MKNIRLIEQLQDRELLVQITNKEILIKQLAQSSITLYCGFDPTADSLHLGNLIPLLCLKRFQQAGHKPIVLIGGATGLIGDPSFKDVERKLNSEEIVHQWVSKIYDQVTMFLDFNCGDNSAIIINNYDWFSSMNLLTFLRDIGKHFSVTQMIHKESVKQRIYHNNHGISFTEFSYSLLQGYDFAYLNKLYGVVLQIGGSDQWGNIISGINLTRRLYQNRVFGLTVPLITKSNGNKFGKTEDGTTIWLDPKKTNPYIFYQFWINTSDTDVYRFLKFFTFIEMEEIQYIKKSKKAGRIPLAQYILAEEMTRLVHGEKGLTSAKRITSSLFKNSISNLNEKDFEQLVKDGIPTVKMKKGTNLIQALVESQLQPSRGQARKNIASNAITVNGKKQKNPEYIFLDNDFLFGRYTLLCHGKKNHCLIYWK